MAQYNRRDAYDRGRESGQKGEGRFSKPARNELFGKGTRENREARAAWEKGRERGREERKNRK